MPDKPAAMGEASRAAPGAGSEAPATMARKARRAARRRIGTLRLSVLAVVVGIVTGLDRKSVV